MITSQDGEFKMEFVDKRNDHTFKQEIYIQFN